jgi:pyruvate/2-oxoglutarate dehydrogenase complex dihydrolipoamide dehydrogenase (E3) component
MTKILNDLVVAGGGSDGVRAAGLATSLGTRVAVHPNAAKEFVTLKVVS